MQFSRKLLNVIVNYRYFRYFVEVGTDVMTDISLSLNNPGTLLGSAVL
jgi:DNA-binding sugar fermentation-stimulating protein